MKKHVFLVILAALAIAGCASSMKDFPKYDQVLVYDRPYDYTYLRTLEALNTFPGWVLEETDKVKGLIVLRNIEYGNLFDRDKWIARFRVKSLGRKKTSVELEPSSQQLTDGGKLLDRVDQIMAMTQKVQGEKRAQLVN